MFWLVLGLLFYCEPDTVLVFTQKEHPDFKLFHYLDRYEELDEYGKKRMISGGAAWIYDLYANDDGTYVFTTEYPAQLVIMHNGRVIATLPYAIVSYFGRVGVAFLGDYVYIAGRIRTKTLYRVRIPTGEVDTIKGILTGGFVRTDQKNRYILLGGIPEDIAKKLGVSPYRHITVYTEDLKPVAVLFGGQNTMSAEVAFAFDYSDKKAIVLRPVWEDKGFIKVCRMRKAAEFAVKEAECSKILFGYPLGVDKYNNFYIPGYCEKQDPDARYVYRISPVGGVTGKIKYKFRKFMGEAFVDKRFAISPGGNYYVLFIDGSKGDWRLVVVRWTKEQFDSFCQ